MYTTALSPCFMIQYSYEKSTVYLLTSDREESEREREKKAKRNGWDWWRGKKEIYWWREKNYRRLMYE